MVSTTNDVTPRNRESTGRVSAGGGRSFCSKEGAIDAVSCILVLACIEDTRVRVISRSLQGGSGCIACALFEVSLTFCASVRVPEVVRKRENEL